MPLKLEDEGDGVCKAVCKYLVFLIPYMLEALLVGTVTPKLLIGLILVQAGIFIVYLIERLVEADQHACSKVAFIVQEASLHAVLLPYAIVFSSRFGGSIWGRIIGYVAFSLVVLSIVFRLQWICKKKNNRSRREENEADGDTEAEAGNSRTRVDRRSGDDNGGRGCGNRPTRNEGVSGGRGRRQHHQDPSHPLKDEIEMPAPPPVPTAPPAEAAAAAAAATAFQSHDDIAGATPIREAPPPYSEYDSNPQPPPPAASSSGGDPERAPPARHSPTKKIQGGGFFGLL